MLALFRWFVGFAVAVSLILFSILNRASTDLIWHPLYDPISAPLYLICLGIMGIGFLLGALLVWINDGQLRKQCRQNKKEIKNLKKDLSATPKQSNMANNDKTENSDFLQLSHNDTKRIS